MCVKETSPVEIHKYTWVDLLKFIIRQYKEITQRNLTYDELGKGGTDLCQVYHRFRLPETYIAHRANSYVYMILIKMDSNTLYFKEDFDQ